MQQEKNKRTREGVVVSDRMQKTCVVAITQVKKHSKYLKYFTVTTKVKVHDEENACHIGDKVVIEETRPLSKDKRWKIVGKIDGTTKKQ
ncbi:MAG: 30S ribosomal protein S17 [Patescibacteria group bacterium]|nr:30S ribosomal protein S17 [Patescibacteria group bacterium]